MSQKNEKPTLSGQRIKTRKRDEKEKYDPTGFRDVIVQGLNEAGPADLDAGFKFLDGAGSKLDYRRYGENLFDILLAGGILAPGGSLAGDGDSANSRTEMCVFAAPDNLDVLRSYAHMITKLTRRYKYLEKTLEDEFKKVLIFLKGFSADERKKLAKVTALLIAGGQVPASVLPNTLQDHLVKDGLALEFILQVFQTWLAERDHATLWGSLRKAGLDSRLLDFFPVSKRTQENLALTFGNHGLGQLVEYQKALEQATVRRELQATVVGLLAEQAPVRELVAAAREYATRYSLPEPDVAVLLWAGLMAAMDWNKKEGVVADQALRHLRQYAPLLAAFTTSSKAELALLVRIQEFCYDNMNFLKLFQKIVYLFYRAEVLSEDVILKWYKEAHSSKGKRVFLDQMKKFTEWLQCAEEESEGEESPAAQQ